MSVPRLLARVILSCLSVVLLEALDGCAAAPHRSDVPDKATTLYVVRRGWHVDVVFATSDLRPPLDTVLRYLPGARYVSFGMGDRHYLAARNKNAPAMLAALWPGPALMLVTGLSDTPAGTVGPLNVVGIPLSNAAMLSAQGYVWSSVRSDAGQPDVEAPGPYQGSLYFASTQTYSAANTCNTWVAKVMKSAGLRAHSTGVVFAGQVWHQARDLAAGAAGSSTAVELPLQRDISSGATATPR